MTNEHIKSLIAYEEKEGVRELCRCCGKNGLSSGKCAECLRLELKEGEKK